MCGLTVSPERSPGRIPIPQVSADDISSTQGRAVRVLVVEDDYLVGLEIEHRLIQAGYSVVGVVGTVEDALAVGRAERPDLAIMDIRLSGPGDGVEAAIALFEGYGIRSIFATAHGNQATRERAKAANPLGWLQKPYSTDALVAAILSALNRRD